MTLLDQMDDPGDLSGVRLVSFEVKNLFNRFDYRIPLNNERHVTAIIAPNGTGKTLCLRLIHSLFAQKWDVFSKTKFSSASYHFNNGIKIRINKIHEEENSEESGSALSFTITIRVPGVQDEIVWRPRFGDPRRLINLERYIPFLTRLGGFRWRHDHTGEVLSLVEIVERHGEYLPSSVRDSIYGKKPAILSALSKKIDCRLIETQRLLILREEPDRGYYGSQTGAHSTLAISQKAEILKDIISGEIKQYAALSQSLDRSFPRRAMDESASLPMEDLKNELQELEVKRSELMNAGILDSEVDDPVVLPEGALQPAVARVLGIYAADTRKKLSSLSGILSKITLFKGLIGQRMIAKDVNISKNSGIDVVQDEAIIPLHQLSSGEQHQLVLFFELLFEIKPGSLILIDEPELSLHIAWQKKFIGDLMKIIELNKFEVILATHSPQLIGRWTDLVVELGDVYGSDDEGRPT